MNELRARMLLRGSMLTAFALSLVSLASLFHWLSLGRELELPMAVIFLATSLCIWLSSRWLRLRGLAL